MYETKNMEYGDNDKIRHDLVNKQGKVDETFFKKCSRSDNSIVKESEQASNTSSKTSSNTSSKTSSNTSSKTSSNTSSKTSSKTSSNTSSSSKTESRGKDFNRERKLMERKIFENFSNDLLFYTTDKKIDTLISEKEKFTHDFINLPENINYVKNYKVSSLYEEQTRVYNKYIELFENIYKIKLTKAKLYETPVQQNYVNKKIVNLIKNMNDFEIFLFFKCTKILNSFIFTYLFLNGYITYLDVYKFSNLEYIYQFYKWGYVFDVNAVKDSTDLLMLTSLFLIHKILIKK